LECAHANIGTERIAVLPRNARPTVTQTTVPDLQPRRWRALGVIVAFVAAPTLGAPLDNLRADVEAGHSQAAYAANCTPASDTGSRTPQFDLWCGIAAVDIGRAGEGALAIERYVLQFPDDLRARLELGRAYFYANDDVRARQEFELVQRVKPPADVQASIDRYLAAIAVREARYLGRKFLYVEAGGGYDSNANAGVAQANLGLPVLGDVTVSPFGVQQGSGFGWLAAGGEIVQPVAPGWSVNAGFYGNGTLYGSASEFNLTRFGAAVGGSYQSERDVYSLNYAYSDIQLDGSRYRWSNGIGFDWRRQITEQVSIAITPQFAQIDYSGDNSAWNSNYSAIAASYRQIWLAAWQPVLNGSIFYADEHNRMDRPDLGRNILGAAADVTVSPLPSWALNAGIVYAESNYDAPIPLIDVTRRDRNTTASAGVLYLFTARLSLRGEYQYTRNASNISLYQYARSVVGVKLRYEFR
jgi:Surface lipoprotein assembly modifier